MRQLLKGLFLVLFLAFLGIASERAAFAKTVQDVITAPLRSYSIRSMIDSDRVFSTADGKCYVADWSGSGEQFFRFEACTVGNVSGYRILSASTGKALTVRSAYAGTEVTLAPRRKDIYQVWLVQYMKNGSMEFLCAANRKYVISMRGDDKTPGTGLVLSPNNHSTARQWTIAPGVIQSATIGMNRKTVTVKATLSKVMPSDDGRIYLIALAPYAQSPKNGIVVASAKAGLRVTLKAELGAGTNRSLLQKKLLLVRKYKGYYFPISNGYFITNPENAATNTKEFPTAKTKKGLKVQLSESCIQLTKDLGVSHAVVDFPLEIFLNGYGCSYVYEGKSYQFSASALTGLVGQLRKVRETGTVVTGIFYLHDRTLTDYILPTAVSGRRYWNAHTFALNTANAKRKTLEALFSCLAEVLTKDDILVANWVFSNEVDQFGYYNYSGDISYAQYHESLADSFRMFNAAVKSKWKNARTYISLDHNWNISTDVTYPGLYLMEDFQKDLAAEGAVHWDMAMHPYPSPEMDCRFWRGSYYVTNDGYSRQITMANAGIFAKYIKSTYGQDVHIIMSETGLCAVDSYGAEREEDQAAAVALAYYLTEFDPNIDMIGIHREMDEANGEWKLGLYRWDNLTFAKSSERLAAEVFRYMDTSDWKKYVGKYAACISKKEDWPSIIRSYGLEFSEATLRR